MAIAGGAILPLLWGKLADAYSAQQAYGILIPCYIIIFLFAVWWYKLRSWQFSNG
jgi:fucose permease